MSAENPHDQYLDASVPSASAAGPTAPSVRDLLTACAAARAISTPPDDGSAAERPADVRSEEEPAHQEPAHQEPAHHGPDRDAA